MGKITMCGFAPHPPLLIPAVGGGNIKHVAATDESLRNLSKKIVSTNPDVLLLITPHGQASYDSIPVLYGNKFKGDFSQFGAPNEKLCFEYSKGLADVLIQAAKNESLKVSRIQGKSGIFNRNTIEMDHGSGVPLYYLKKAGLDVPVVILGLGLLPFHTLYEYGRVLAGAIRQSSYSVAIVASGDLSHSLSENAPAGYNPKGKEFDHKLVEYMKSGDVDGILNMDQHFVEEAAECGFRPLVMSLGMLHGESFSSKVYSYEGPFGVGYSVAEFVPNSTKRSLEENSSLSEPVSLAKKAVEAYVSQGKKIKPPTHLSDVLKERAGAFVSLKKNGQLRGCIGTIGPTCSNVAEEIITNAINAAMEDPRFDSVKAHELKDITYSVDILGHPEPVSSIEELDPRAYGVIVSKGMRRGLLLPDLEGVDTPLEQVAIACRKAGIQPNESDIELERFIVTRYS